MITSIHNTSLWSDIITIETVPLYWCIYLTKLYTIILLITPVFKPNVRKWGVISRPPHFHIFCILYSYPWIYSLFKAITVLPNMWSHKHKISMVPSLRIIHGLTITSKQGPMHGPNIITYDPTMKTHVWLN